MRYFFHVMSDHTAYKDGVGRSFSHVEIARADATVIARELRGREQTTRVLEDRCNLSPRSELNSTAGLVRYAASCGRQGPD